MLEIEKLLYTQEEAAQALGVSLRSIERMVSAAQVRTKKMGRRRNIPATEVRRIAREGLVEIGAHRSHSGSDER